MIFGVYFIGIYCIGFFDCEVCIDVGDCGGSFFGVYIFGFVFVFGWMFCIGF